MRVTVPFGAESVELEVDQGRLVEADQIVDHREHEQFFLHAAYGRDFRRSGLQQMRGRHSCKALVLDTNVCPTIESLHR